MFKSSLGVVLAMILAACGPAPAAAPLSSSTPTIDSGATATAIGNIAATVRAQGTAPSQALETADAQSVANRAATTRAQGTATSQALETADAQFVANRAATASAQGTATAQSFSATVDALMKNANKAYGPSDGVLEQKAGFAIPLQSSRVFLRNFAVEARFFNPADRPVHTWDYGFGFRSSDVPLRNAEYRLRVRSNETWNLLVTTGEKNPDQTIKTTTVASGTLKNLDVTTSGSNVLRAVIQETTGYFFVNDQFIASLNLADRNVAGDIYVATGFAVDTEFPGLATRFKDFIVWSLP